jgi:hypothetical protein
MKRNTIIFITLLSIITMLSCSYENTATVTIDTGIRKQAQLSLFDKVLAFFSLAQPLKADPPPQNYNFDALELNVTASDMSTITRRYAIEELYNNYGKITLEVPAGNQRLFTVIAGNSEGEEIYNRIYGGIATVDLSPGQNVNLDIEMGELFIIPEGYVTYTNYKISFSTNKDYHPLAFNIYQYVGNQWIFYTRLDIATFTIDEGEDIHSYSTYIDLPSGNNYGIAGVNKYGEGEIYQIPY